MFDPHSSLPDRFAGLKIARIARQIVTLALVLGLPRGWQNTAQQSHSPDPYSGNPRGDLSQILRESQEVDSVQEERRLRLLNADRQKSMVADTDKLLKLVREYNAEVASNDSSSLSPNELRQLAEIEKLAHSVKEKMSTSVRGVPVYLQPPPVFR